MLIDRGHNSAVVPFFFVKFTCSLLAAIAVGCGNIQPKFDTVVVKKPHFSFFLLDSNLFRLVGGLTGDTGLTYQSAIQMAKVFCKTKDGEFQELSWLTRPLDSVGGENTIRVGALEFFCAVPR